MGRHGFSRLVWKEFHAQSALWLALAIGTLLLLSLQLLPQETFGTIPAFGFYVALVMTTCYAGASGAILFAAEKEEQTDDWLRQLPIPTSTFIGAKFTWMLASTLMFAAFSGSAAWVSFTFTGGKSDEQTPFYVTLFLRALASMMVWSVLFSLLFHRVLLALLTALVMEFVFSITTGNLPIPDPAKDAIFAIVVIAVAIVDVLLARRWYSTKPFRVSSMVPRPPARQRAAGRPTIWQIALQWAASRASLPARMLWVLVWREARGAVPFLFWWGLTGILCILVVPWYGMNHFYLAATPAIFGMLTYIGDRRQNSFRFYVERGISPRLVWLSKQLVWGLAMLAMVAVFYNVDAGWNDRHNIQSPSPVDVTHASVANTIRDAIGVPWPGHTTRPLVYQMQGAALRRWYLATLGLALFGLGQLAAIWIPRTIIAAAFVLTVAPFTVIGLGGLVALDVPLSATAFPLAVFLLLATLLTFGDCLLERRTWRKRLAKVAWIAIPCLLFLLQFRSMRMLPAMDDNPPVNVADVERQTRSSSTNWENQWRDLLGELAIVSRALQSQQTGQAIPSSTVRFAKKLAEIGDELATQSPPLPPVMFLSNDGALPHSFSTIATFALRDAEAKTEAGKFRPAWKTQLHAARITRYLSQQTVSWVGWNEALTAYDLVLDSMQTWATSPDVPTELLEEALADLKTLQQPLTARSMLERRYVVVRQILEQRGPAWDWALQQASGQTQLLENVVTAGVLTGDAERLRSMLDYATAMALTGDTVPEALIDPDTRRTQSAADSQELAELSLRRAAASTMLVPPRLFTFDPYLQSDVLNIDGAMNRNLTLQRATLLVLALQVWHREHGQFPRYLSQLAEVLLTDVPPDSLSTGAWGYAPEGLPAPLLVSRRTVVPAGQPLLWSRGPFDLDIVYYSRSQQTGVGETPPNRYVVTPFYRPTQDPSPGVNDSSGGEPQPNRIRFLLLGTD